jgi:hypothetical protein
MNAKIQTSARATGDVTFTDRLMEMDTGVAAAQSGVPAPRVCASFHVPMCSYVEHRHQSGISIAIAAGVFIAICSSASISHSSRVLGTPAQCAWNLPSTLSSSGQHVRGNTLSAFRAPTICILADHIQLLKRYP